MNLLMSNSSNIHWTALTLIIPGGGRNALGSDESTDLILETFCILTI